MNLQLILASATALGALWVSSAQNTMTPVETTRNESQAGTQLDADTWAKDLRDPSLQQRQARYDELLVAASHDAQVRQQVEDWAADEGNLELAWTAHLILRELDTRSAHRPVEKHGLGWLFQGQGDPFQDLLEDLNSRDPFADWGMGGLSSPMTSPFQGLAPQPGQHGTQESSGLQVEIGPKGVKVRVEDIVNGESQTQTYEADSLEALFEAHPELKQRSGLGAIMPGFSGPHAGQSNHLQRSLAPGSIDNESGGQQGLRRIEPSLDHLGIRMLAPESRSPGYEDAPADVGLQVLEVIPGSLADVVGIRAGELVMTIAGQSIRSAQDVRAALQTCSITQRIDIKCVQPSGEIKVRSWIPN